MKTGTPAHNYRRDRTGVQLMSTYELWSAEFENSGMECCFCRAYFTIEEEFFAHMLTHQKDPRPQTASQREEEKLGLGESE